MKVRVLYPTAVDPHVKKPSAAGDIVDIDESAAKGLMAEGFVEKSSAKGDVEQATAAPGEKRGTRRKKP